MKTKSELNELSGIIVDAAIEVHRELGPELLTYLRLSEKKLGLLINFHVPLLKNGIKRLVHQFPSE